MTKTTNKIHNLALLGYPVSHSVSPEIHHEFLVLSGLKGSYSAIETKPEELIKNVRALQQLGFAGINLTIPHKESVFEILDSISPEAELIQAVNTLVFRDSQIFGDNTDWLGFLESLPEDLKKQKELRACVLGAGGSAKAVLLALLKLDNLKELYFVIRKSPSGEKNLELLDSIIKKTKKPIELKKAYFEDLSKLETLQFNLVVNTTPLGLAGENQKLSPINQDFIDNFCSSEKCCFYDLIYNPAQTEFLRLAQQNGLQIINGYKMLKLQAAYSFKLWTTRKDLSFLRFD